MRSVMDIAAIPREFPQFGRSVKSLVRPAEEVSGSRKETLCGCSTGGECGCGLACSSGCTGKCAGGGWQSARPIEFVKPNAEPGSAGVELGALLEEAYHPLGRRPRTVACLTHLATVATDGRDPSKTCGPDITAYVVEKLVEVVSGASGSGTHCFPGGALDFKGASSGVEGCPKDCQKSLTLCGTCVHEDVPGNICFGAAVGFSAAAGLGMIDAFVGAGGESAEDQTSYMVGDRLTQTNQVSLEEQLCYYIRILRNPVSCYEQPRWKYGFEDMPCTLCKTPRSGPPRLPKGSSNGNRLSLGPPDGTNPWLGSWNPSVSYFDK
jgi:hypothetical protein